MSIAKQAPRFLPTLTEVVHKSLPAALKSEVPVNAAEFPAHVEVTDSNLEIRVRELVNAYLDEHLQKLLDQHMQQRLPQIHDDPHLE